MVQVIEDYPNMILEAVIASSQPENYMWRRFGGFIFNLEHTLHLFSSVSVVNFEQVNVGWDYF